MEDHSNGSYDESLRSNLSTDESFEFSELVAPVRFTVNRPPLADIIERPKSSLPTAKVSPLVVGVIPLQWLYLTLTEINHNRHSSLTRRLLETFVVGVVPDGYQLVGFAFGCIYACTFVYSQFWFGVRIHVSAPLYFRLESWRSGCTTLWVAPPSVSCGWVHLPHKLRLPHHCHLSAECPAGAKWVKVGVPRVDVIPNKSLISAAHDGFLIFDRGIY